MEDAKNKNAFVVVKATHHGLPITGITVIPVQIYQQHGNDVVCITKTVIDGQEIDCILTFNKSAILFNINEVNTVINSTLLTDKKSEVKPINTSNDSNGFTS